MNKTELLPPDASSAFDDVKTLPALFRWRVTQTPESEAYRQFDHGTSRWISHSWHEMGARVKTWCNALVAEGLQPGDRIAILMPNSVEHVSMDLAALSCGMVPVPLHAIDNPESIIYILQDSGASLLFIESAEQWEKLAAEKPQLPALKRVVCAQTSKRAPNDGKPSDDLATSLNEWLGSSRTSGATAGKIEPEAGDLASIVYTSGTTGRPKGVMLSHGNIVANVKAIQERLKGEQSDIFLSFLPLSHTFERTAGYYYPMATGACVAYARSTQHLPEDLRTIRPTVLISVPRIYERFHAKIMELRSSSSALARMMLDMTLTVGNRRFDCRQHQMPPGWFDELVWPILKRTVASKILDQFGGRLRIAVSGGAPLALPIAKLFLATGLDLLQGYGMTETSPVVSCNTPDENDPRSVGKPLAGVEIKVGDNDELLVRAPSVMLGYWHKPEETRRTIEPDGWLHTGDQARIENGQLFITGRIKDIIVTSTGEKIAPADLESAIISDPLFEQAMIVGEQRPFLSAMVVLNATEWQLEKAKLERTSQGVTESGQHMETNFIRQRIAKAVRNFPAYATPRAVWWTTEPWTVAEGLLTPTLKIKRMALEKHLAHEIADIYSRRPAAPEQSRPT